MTTQTEMERLAKEYADLDAEINSGKPWVLTENLSSMEKQMLVSIRICNALPDFLSARRAEMERVLEVATEMERSIVVNALNQLPDDTDHFDRAMQHLIAQPDVTLDSVLERMEEEESTP